MQVVYKQMGVGVDTCLVITGNLVDGGLSDKGIQLLQIQMNQEIGCSGFGEVP